MQGIIVCFCTVFAVASSACAQGSTEAFRLRYDQLASADKEVNDVSAFALTVAKPLLQAEPFTIGVQSGFLSAKGTAVSLGDPRAYPANARALFAGGYLRISPNEPLLITPFAEGGIALLATDQPFPDNPALRDFEGRIYGKFDVRWGVDLALNDRLGLEAAFAFTHISNGSGFGPQNINYDGIGFSLGLISAW